MTTKNYELDPSLAEPILAWAQSKLDTMPDDEFGGDWWGQYNESYEVNIWNDDITHHICVTVYPIITNATTGEAETDFTKYNRVGTIDVALWNYDFESCGSCGTQMNKKWGSTYPHRHDEQGIICGQCWDDLASEETV